MEGAKAIWQCLNDIELQLNRARIEKDSIETRIQSLLAEHKELC